MAMEYKVVAGNQSASNPGNGNMRFNTVGQSDATAIYFCALGVGNIDYSATFLAAKASDVLYSQLKTNTSVIGNFTINSVTDNGGWFTLAVTPGECSGFPMNAAAIFDIFEGQPETVPVKKYQYMIHDYEHSQEIGDLQAMLNELGFNGWYLIRFSMHDAETSRVIFVREIS
jgi:hypothetical protein